MNLPNCQTQERNTDSAYSTHKVDVTKHHNRISISQKRAFHCEVWGRVECKQHKEVGYKTYLQPLSHSKATMTLCQGSRFLNFNI
uniref:Uncharacterized protein n=1 Tax=Rhizophora mucronata TaxID=61149 RepID=A0A2P2QWX7_RHIMU